MSDEVWPTAIEEQEPLECGLTSGNYVPEADLDGELPQEETAARDLPMTPPVADTAPAHPPRYIPRPQAIRKWCETEELKGMWILAHQDEIVARGESLEDAWEAADEKEMPPSARLFQFFVPDDS